MRSWWWQQKDSWPVRKTLHNSHVGEKKITVQSSLITLLICSAGITNRRAAPTRAGLQARVKPLAYIGRCKAVCRDLPAGLSMFHLDPRAYWCPFHHPTAHPGWQLFYHPHHNLAISAKLDWCFSLVSSEKDPVSARRQPPLHLGQLIPTIWENLLNKLQRELEE